MDQTIKLQILEANYWEHFKFAKDISFFLPLDHPTRLKLELELSKMIQEINQIKSEQK